MSVEVVYEWTRLIKLTNKPCPLASRKKKKKNGKRSGSVSFSVSQVLLGLFYIGFAFIEFEDFRDAEDAVRDMDGRHVCGVRIKVEMARKSSK